MLEIVFCNQSQLDGDMLQLVVVLTIVHLLNLKPIMQNIIVSFSTNCSTTKIVFLKKLLCQWKCYLKIQIYCHKIWNNITRPNCALDRSTKLCLYVPGFQRQVFKREKILSERSKESKEQKKNKGSNLVAKSSHNAQNAQFGLVMKL